MPEIIVRECCHKITLKGIVYEISVGSELTVSNIVCVCFGRELADAIAHLLQSASKIEDVLERMQSETTDDNEANHA